LEEETIKMTLPRQIPAAAEAQAIESAGTTAQNTSFFIMAANFVLAGSLSLLWAMLNGLQL